MIGSIALVVIMLSVDVYLLKSGTYINMPSSTGEHYRIYAVVYIDESGLPQEDRNAVTPWLPIILTGLVLVRMVVDPIRVLVYHMFHAYKVLTYHFVRAYNIVRQRRGQTIISARAPNWVDGLDGKWSWSWRFLGSTGQTEIATTMLSVPEAGFPCLKLKLDPT